MSEIAATTNLLTYREAARLLGFKDKQGRIIARLVAEGKLIAVDIGTGKQGKRISPFDLQKFIEQRRTVLFSLGKKTRR